MEDWMMLMLVHGIGSCQYNLSHALFFLLLSISDNQLPVQACPVVSAGRDQQP